MDKEKLEETIGNLEDIRRDYGEEWRKNKEVENVLEREVNRLYGRREELKVLRENTEKQINTLKTQVKK